MRRYLTGDGGSARSWSHVPARYRQGRTVPYIRGRDREPGADNEKQARIRKGSHELGLRVVHGFRFHLLVVSASGSSMIV